MDQNELSDLTNGHIKKGWKIKNKSSMTCGTIHNGLTYAKIELWLIEDVYSKPYTVTKTLKIIKSKKEIQLNLLRNNPRKAEK